MLSLKSLASCKTAVGGLRAQDSHTIELTQKWVAHKLYTAFSQHTLQTPDRFWNSVVDVECANH